MIDLLMIDQFKLKIGFTFLLFIFTFIFFLFPIKFIFKQFENGFHNKLILNYSNCISAGIFIAMCFLQMFPLVRHEFEEFFKETRIAHFDYPVSELTILIGFFLVLAIEQLLLNFKESKKPPVLYLDDKVNEQGHHLLDDLINKPTSDQAILDENSSLSEHSLNFNRQNLGRFHSHSHNFSHHDAQFHFSDSKEISFFMLIFASGIHSVFEGLALGLVKNTAILIDLFFGILIHECIMAFALGFNSIGLSNHIKFGLVFASSIPIGIFLGLALNTTSGIIGKFISSIFQGLAAGTFIHVAFFELVPSELLTNESGSVKLFKIFLVFAGFVGMALLA